MFADCRSLRSLPKRAKSAWAVIVSWCLLTVLSFASAPTGADEPFALLVFSKTAGFRHDYIPAGIAAIRALGTQHGFAVDATEAPGIFSDEPLAKYGVV